ncbi:unnamed protein product, partial [Cladocopium goreaui]
MSQENVENMLSSYTPTYIEEKDARCGGVEVFYGMTTGEGADATDLMLPASLKEFWVQQQANSAHVMGKNPEEVTEQRKAYSLYGMWEELSARAEASASLPRIMPSKSYLNLAVVPKPDDQQKTLELKGVKRIVVDPHSEFRLVWSLIALLFVVFDAISIPVMVSWEIPSSELVGILLPMNFYWTMDMFFSAQTGALNKGRVREPVDGLTPTAAKWARKWCQVEPQLKTPYEDHAELRESLCDEDGCDEYSLGSRFCLSWMGLPHKTPRALMGEPSWHHCLTAGLYERPPDSHVQHPAPLLFCPNSLPLAVLQTPKAGSTAFTHWMHTI